MALAMTMSFGSPCSGGGHYHMTATVTGAMNVSDTTEITREEMLVAPTKDELIPTAKVLARAMIAQLGNKTNANIKTILEAKVIDLTVIG